MELDSKLKYIGSLVSVQFRPIARSPLRGADSVYGASKFYCRYFLSTASAFLHLHNNLVVEIYYYGHERSDCPANRTEEAPLGVANPAQHLAVQSHLNAVHVGCKWWPVMV